MMSEEETQRYADQQAKLFAQRPIESRYALATIGSKTVRGGRVVSASTTIEVNHRRVACVGDMVRYPDGGESKIISGAGFAAAYSGNPLAIVGSHIENGDTIIDSFQENAYVIQYADAAPISGLLEADYFPVVDDEI